MIRAIRRLSRGGGIAWLVRKVTAFGNVRISVQLRCVHDGRWVRTVGMVTLRQQPPTAKGTVFLLLEDEHGSTQVIVWRPAKEAQRQVLLVQGRWQREGAVCNLIAHRLWDLSHLLGRLATQSRDFR